MASSNKKNVTWKCPFCDKRYDKQKLVIHVDDKHQDELPEGFTAMRYVFHYINKKPLDYHGRCTECKGPTPWDEEVGRYKRQCGKKACHDSYVKRFEENMVKKKGYTRETSTQEGIERMLKNRKISGYYTFQDGKKLGYVGSYEKKCLEFMDKVMNIDADDILAPGPTMEYIYDGKKHYYISDFFYQPYNLIIEVKDGGDHPNMRNMEEYRKKQIAKEEYIIKNTNYNYIRLTDNDFAQLMSVFADLKMQLIDHSNDRVIHVNEAGNIDISFTSDIELLDWMNRNIRYSNFTKLKSHDEVLESKYGSCHDQVMFEYDELRRLGYNPRGLFLIETDDKGQGGVTHSLVYYKNKEGEICWFENAWGDMEGINIPGKDENNLTGIKNWIRGLHDIKKFGDKDKFPNLIFHSFPISAHRPGESLQEFIDICLSSPVKEDATEDLINRTAVKYDQGKITDMLNKKNIIFDFGDVLTNYREEDAIKGITDVPEEAIVSIVAAFHNYWRDDKPEDKSYEEEMIDAKEYVPDEYKEYSDRMYEELHEYSNPFDYTEKMLSELNRLGYNLYYLSNWSKGSWLHMVETGKFDFMKFFKGGIASWQTGTKKPDRRIYEMLLDKYGLKAEECIFFDDKEKNIEAAREVGIYGIKWEPDMDKEVIKYAKMGADRNEEETFNEFMNALTSGFFPGYKECDSYIVMSDYMQNNVFADCGHNFFAITDDPAMHHLLYVNNEGVLCYDSLEDFDKTYPNLADSLSVFALEVPASGIKDALARYIGKELSREDMYYSVFKERLYSIDQARFSKKVLGEVNNELYDFNAIYEMTKGTLIYGKEDMLPKGNHEFYNIRNGKTYVQSELNSNFFTEANSPKSKMFMEQIICGGMINNG